MQAIETFLHNGRKVSIYVDQDPSDPRKDFDNLTTLTCWHRRVNLGDKRINGETTAKELIRSLRNQGEKVLALIPLYLYEHGGITMSTRPFLCRFDSGQVGWGYVTQTDADKMGCVGPTYNKSVFENAIREEVESYNDYLAGRCYGYQVEGRDGDNLDSCWGFLGDIDYVRSEAKIAAEFTTDPAVDREVEMLQARATFANCQPGHGPRT